MRAAAGHVPPGVPARSAAAADLPAASRVGRHLVAGVRSRAEPGPRATVLRAALAGRGYPPLGSGAGGGDGGGHHRHRRPAPERLARHGAGDLGGGAPSGRPGAVAERRGRTLGRRARVEGAAGLPEEDLGRAPRRGGGVARDGVPGQLRRGAGARVQPERPEAAGPLQLPAEGGLPRGPPAYGRHGKATRGAPNVISGASSVSRCTGDMGTVGRIEGSVGTKLEEFHAKYYKSLLDRAEYLCRTAGWIDPEDLVQHALLKLIEHG